MSLIYALSIKEVNNLQEDNLSRILEHEETLTDLRFYNEAVDRFNHLGLGGYVDFNDYIEKYLKGSWWIKAHRS